MDHHKPGSKTPETRSPFLSTKEAADYLSLSPRTLEKMRVLGRGPRFRRHGRKIRYHIAEIDAWSVGRSNNSTSEYAALQPRRRKRRRATRAPAASASLPEPSSGNG